MTIDQTGKGPMSREDGHNDNDKPLIQLANNVLPSTHSDSGESGFLLLTDYQVSLEGVFLSLPNASIPYEDILTAWEDAFIDYLFLSPEAFVAALHHAVGEDTADSAPNFLNVSWEDLFNIPVTEGGGESVSVAQATSEGGVISVEKVFDINGISNSLLNSVIAIQSVPVSFSAPLPFSQPLSILLPTIPFPNSPIPNTPTLSSGDSHFPNITASTIFASELFLNTYESVVVQGNIFSGSFGFPVGADAGAGASVVSVSASFSASNISGGSLSNPMPGVILLTTVEGNTLTFYTANVDGHLMGDFFYTLNNAVLTPPLPGTVISIGPDTIKFYLDGFLYSVTNNFGNTSVGQLNFLITDDKPVALDQIAPGISEADIATVGSAGHTSAAVVTGSLVTPIALNGDLIVNPSTTSAIKPDSNASYFGANGGHVSSVTLQQVQGATKDGTNAVTATSTPSGNTITVTDNLGNVLQVNTLTGAYSYTLNAAFHDNVPNGSATIIFIYTFTDNEGQTASATLTINVADDSPIAKAIDGGTVYEAGLSGGSGVGTTTTTLSGSLIGGANGGTFGADGGVVSKVSFGSTTYTAVNGVITAHDGYGNTLIVNADGSYTYTLSNPVTNVNNQPLVEVFNYTLTDADGSTSTNTFTIHVGDDAPVAKAIDGGTVYEAGLSGGSGVGATTTTLSGSLIGGANGGTFGADGGVVSKIVFGSTTYTAVNGVITAHDGYGNTLVVNADGSYTYTLSNPVTNVNNQPLVEVYNYTLTDADGSTSTNTFTIHVGDDAPVAKAIDGGTVYEAGLASGSGVGSTTTTLSGSLIGGANGGTFGADGGVVSKVSFGGTDYTAVNGVITAHDGYGNTLIVNADGSYTYTLSNPVTNVNNQPLAEVFNYTLTDADGSTSTNTFTIHVGDDAPVAKAIDGGTVYEAGLASGSGVGSTTTTLSGSLIGGANGGIFGADGGVVSKVSFGGTDYTAVNGVITAHDSDGNTFVVNADGSYTYTLSHAVTNVNGQPLTEVFNFTLTDVDGSTSSSTFTINVGDDAPVAVAVDRGTVYEAGITGGSEVGSTLTQVSGFLILNTGSTLGADGGVVSKITFGSSTYTPVNGMITAHDDYGNTLMVQVDGTYIYTLSHAVTNVNGQPLTEVFTYTLKDADGSTASNTFTIKVGDDAPVAKAVDGGTVYEAGLTGGSGVGSTTTTVSGSLIGVNGSTFGADGGTVTNTTTTMSGWSTSIVSGVITVSDGLGNQITINPNGSYTFSLDHAVTNVNNQPLSMVFHFTFTDADGSTASNDLTIKVNDDAPVAKAVDGGTVYEAGLANGSGVGSTTTTVSGSLIGVSGSTFGADGGVVSKVSFGSTDYAPVNGVITAQDGFGNTFVVNADGSYTYTLSNAVTNVDGQPLTEAFNFTFTDTDGSTSSNTFTINVNDDVPAAFDQSVNAPAITTSETGNLFTLTSGTGTDLVTNTVGADGVGHITITAGSDFTGTSSISGNEETFTDSNNNTFVFNLDTGAYTFTYNAGIGTPTGIESFNYTLFDKDGSASATKSLSFTGLNSTTPVVLDLTGEGIHLLSASQSSVTINDITGSGNQQHIGWITSGEGVLMLDTNGDGKLTNINQIAFTSYTPGAKTDLQGLIAFDTNHDGMLDVGDKNFNQFGVLLSNGKFESLSQLGIVSISLTSDNHQETVNGNTVYGYSSYKTANGVTHSVADVGFTISADAKGATLHTQDILTDKQPIDFSKLPEMQPAAQMNSTEQSSSDFHASSSSTIVSHDASAQFAGAMSANTVQHISEQLSVQHHEITVAHG